MTEQTIIRYLNNQCTDKELQEVSRWIQLSDENANFLFEMEQLFDEAFLSEELSQEKEKILERIRKRINSENSETDNQ